MVQCLPANSCFSLFMTLDSRIIACGIFSPRFSNQKLLSVDIQAHLVLLMFNQQGAKIPWK